ncbi:MAG: NAD(P)H-dependent oxidoreductase subunit E, partial [Anaerolineae bacterium]|nr:NAD(P)H-dependent oxidoreductase subunit E [Anaerolineae bacterium]
METLQPFVEKVSSLSDDPRWRHVQQTMLLYGYQPHALIEVLHTVQEEFGYLDMQALRLVSDALKVRPSKVFGVATFYHLFTL